MYVSLRIPDGPVRCAHRRFTAVPCGITALLSVGNAYRLATHPLSVGLPPPHRGHRRSSAGRLLEQDPRGGLERTVKSHELARLSKIDPGARQDERALKAAFKTALGKLIGRWMKIAPSDPSGKPSVKRRAPRRALADGRWYVRVGVPGSLVGVVEP